MYSIYKITNKVNGKVYIGFTKDPERRWAQHRKKKNNLFPLHQAFIKHGMENFVFEIIYQHTDRKHVLMEMEPHFIEQYQALTWQNGYNCTMGGHNTNNDEMRQRNSQRMKRDNPMHNPETRQKVSQTLMGKYVGRKHTKETCEAIRIGKLGEKNPNYGNPESARFLMKKTKCMHCGIESVIGNISRWHNDNCKQKR